MMLFDDATTPGKTQWGFANAVTATARDTADPDRRAELERMGFTMATEAPARFHNDMRALAVVKGA